MTTKKILAGLLAAILLGVADSMSDVASKVASTTKVLSEHKVTYSSARVDTKYASDDKFNARGMHHVYAITHVFLDLIQRDQVFPPSLNASVVLATSPDAMPELLQEHWEELMLQYIGIVTLAVCGILLALAVPVAGFCVCCCRCAGKCGAYPEHFDKRGDACKRVTLGIVMAALVIAAMFGVVSAFVTNHYATQGVKKLPDKLAHAADDTSKYLDNTGKEVHALLVTNFAELEEVLYEILDESGSILKRNLAQVTQAVAIDNLADIVSGLGNVKRHLRDIQNKTQLLQDKVGQLRLGLSGAKNRLLSALKDCNTNKVCVHFMQEYNIERDLSVAADFEKLPQQLPNVSRLLADIAGLMDNDIVKKVRGGQKQLDKVKVDISASIGDIVPEIKSKIKRMGKRLEDKAAEVQSLISEVDVNLGTVHRDIPKIEPLLNEYGSYLQYMGLGMGCMVLLILFCHVFGLFYGFCGKRPGNVYGDDCCNTGTGANWLLAGVYLTFLFSLVLLVMTTAQFLIGSTADKIACEALKRPNESDVFKVVDRRFVQPLLREQYPREWASLSLREIISSCHRNKTMYDLLNLEQVYKVEELRNWRTEYGVNKIIASLKNGIGLDDELRDIEILSPQAKRDLVELADSQISDLNFTHYTRLLGERITSLDLGDFVQRLTQLRERLGRSQGAKVVGHAIDNDIMFLSGMQKVVIDMQLGMRQLQDSVAALERDAKFKGEMSMREALKGLIKQATAASEFLKTEGPQLVDTLASRYVNETVGLIDAYVERVINHTHNYVGRCEPLSTSYNATVIALCNEIVDPFNGFWASIGWCYLFYLPTIALALALVSLYRKSEPYPGPLVEAQPEDAGPPRGSRGKKKRGHRRNASEYLPDSAHYRAGYSYQDRENRFQDVAPRNYDIQQTSSQAANNAPLISTNNSGQPAGGPPRYTSNPNLVGEANAASAAAAAVNPEYERPPPYYYPGAPPVTASAAPPPLPAPNRP